MVGIALMLMSVPVAMGLTLARVRLGRQVVVGIAGLVLGIQVGASYLAQRAEIAWDCMANAAEEVPNPVAKATEKADKPVASVKETPDTPPADPVVEKTVKDEASDPARLRTRPEVPIVSDVRYLAESRPDWLEMPPTYERGELQVAVRGGPYQKARDCEADLDQQVQHALRDFIRDHLHSEIAPTLLQYSLKELRTKHVVRQEFSEQLATRFGVMSQVHAQLVFDQSFQNELDERWYEIRAKSRLAQLGIGVAVLLLFLTTLFGFLRIDLATRGSYTGRLQFGAAAMILTLVAASVLLARWIPWL